MIDCADNGESPPFANLDRLSRRVVSVEYSHLYADRGLPLSQSECDGIGIAASHVDQLTRSGSVCFPVVMIDDYSVEAMKLSPDEAIHAITEQGLAPEAVVFESSMVDLAENLLDGVERRSTARSIERWQEAHQRWPCSLMVAAWYLFRLGELPPASNHRPVRNLSGGSFAITADVLLNVLADTHRASEAEAMRIIAASRWAGAHERITTIFHSSATNPSETPVLTPGHG